MSSTSINTLSAGTINGLTSLDLDSLTTTELSATNIDGNLFTIDTIEANDIRCDGILELTESGVIVIGKDTEEEITITDTQIGYLDGITSNIQTQINNVNGNTSQLQIDLDELEDDVNANQHSIGLILGVQDDLYVKTILQSASSIQQKTTFSGKLILSSLSNLDIGVEIQANTVNVGILTTQQTANTNAISNLSTQQTTNTSNISNLSSQQTTNTSNIATNTTNIATNLSKINTNTSNISNLSTQQITNTININHNALQIGTTTSPVNSLFNRVRYITTTTNNTSIQHALTVDGVNVINKFITIDSDILGLSNTATSLNIAINGNTTAINNNLSKITLNTNNIEALQVKVAPVGSIMFYAGTTAPTNWYICNGDLISKSSNIELWSLLGDTYLAGRTPQTLSFYLPDLRQLFITGAGDNSAYPVNATNKNVGDYNAQSIQQHAHNYQKPNNSTNVGGSFAYNTVWDNNTTTTATTGVITTGGGQLPSNSETRPYCMAMNYIIKK
jgi:microcystin-dependent protein